MPRPSAVQCSTVASRGSSMAAPSPPGSSGSRAGPGTIESLISKVDPTFDSGTIKSALRNIREKIHNSKQFYKDFLVKFYASDGGSKLLEILKEKIEDEQVIDLSVSVLATCCLDKNNAEQVNDSSGISIIASILRHYSKSSVSITNRCARALANLAKSVDIEENLEEDVVPILVQALDVTEESGCCHSLLRVLKIFASSKNKTILWNVIDCGGLRVVCKQFKSKDSKLVLLAVETAVALTAPFDKRKLRCALTLPVAAANPVLENDSLSNLFDLLSHHKPEIQYHSWECIGNLMSSDIGRAALGNAGFVKFYLATAKNEDVKMSVRERCAQYLCLCCQDSVNRAKMAEFNGLQFLVDLLSKDSDSLPDVPSTPVIAAIAEFRFDTSAMEQFAKLNLLKVLMLHLQKKVKARSLPLQEETSETEGDTLLQKADRKRKRKRHRETSKKAKRDSDLEDSDPQTGVDVDKHLLNPPRTLPRPLTPDCDDGLSPQYSLHWYPESPRHSPPLQSNLPGSSPSKYYASGLSPPRGYFSASPPHTHQPTYQFPTSMMSPPKSDSTSPGSSPSYFYDPSSPQKFFGYSEEIFSPVVSEESESDSSASLESCESVDEKERVIDVKMVKNDEDDPVARREHDDGQPSGLLLAQATRKLTLLKCDTTGLPPSETTANVVTGFSSGGGMDCQASTTSPKGKNESGGKSRLPSPKPSTSSSGNQSGTAGRALRIPASPRTSFSGDLTDGERTPSKEREQHHKRRYEEEYIMLIFQEMILLHHIPSILYIATECSVETLLYCSTRENVVSDRAHLLLKDILSSRFFFDKLMAHNIPYIIYKLLTAREKQFGRVEKQEHVSRMSRSTVDQEQSRMREYLDTLRDIAETSFGQKEMEHVLIEQQKEGKLSAALSLPYLYSTGRILRNLIVDCETVQQMLQQLQNQQSKELLRKVSHSLSRASRLLLPHYGEYRDRHFTVNTMPSSDEVVSNPGGDVAGSSDLDECLYRAQENLVDVNLVCSGGETLRASRQILSARSEYFACLLTGHFQEAEQESINLGSMQIKSLTCVVHSLYDCHPRHCRTLRNLERETFESLLDIIAVIKFCMTSKDNLHHVGPAEFCALEQWVTHIILNCNLVDRTVCRLVEFAALHNCQKLLESCLLFVLGRCSRLRKHLRVLLASELSDQIKSCIVELFQNAQ